jgi:hypothetical protein
VLEIRFNVFVLIPMIAAISVIVIACGFVAGAGVAGTLIPAGLAASFLQFGYLGGVFVRYYGARPGWRCAQELPSVQ